MRTQQVGAGRQLAQGELAETIAHREPTAGPKGGHDDTVEWLSVVVKDDTGDRSVCHTCDLGDAGRTGGFLCADDSRLQSCGTHD